MDRNSHVFWVAAAAVAQGGGTLPPEALSHWRDGLQAAGDPAVATQIVQSAFPDLKNTPIEEISDVAWALVQKSLSGACAAPQAHGVSSADALLAPLRPAAAARPGVSTFIAHCIVNIWSSNRGFNDIQSLSRAIDVLLWAAETAAAADGAAPAPPLAALATALTQSGLLSDISTCIATMPLGTKLRALKLVGLCTASAPAAAMAAWQGLDAALQTEVNGLAMHLGACALFGGLSAHPPADPAWQMAAAGNIARGLCTWAPEIQFPAAVAAGTVLRSGNAGADSRFWVPEAISHVSTAAVQALGRLEQSVGAWGAWRAPGGDGETEQGPAAAEEVRGRSLTPQHVLSVIKILQNDDLL